MKDISEVEDEITVQKPEPEVVNFLRSPGIIFSLAGWYDNPVWRTGLPGYIDWRNRFLRIGTDSLESIPGLLKRFQIRALL